MQAIGGYFELELPLGEIGHHYHCSDNFVTLNSGRGAFEYALTIRGYKKVLLPFYTCDVMLEPINRLKIDVEFYHVDHNLDPIFDRQLQANEVFVYTNYYGVKQATANQISQQFDRVIIDNSQAFFAEPITNKDGVDTFYSARKFIGVGDGAYLYTNCSTRLELPQDVSHGRMSHLLKRLEQGPQAGYNDFCVNDESIVGQGPKIMSELTSNLLQRVHYNNIIEKRKDNFVSLHQQLRKTNGFVFDLTENDIPMVYPYLCKNEVGPKLRRRLIASEVFVAQYWPNVCQWTSAALENNLVANLLPLPIDQRVCNEHLNRIIEIIEQ